MKAHWTMGTLGVIGLALAAYATSFTDIQVSGLSELNGGLEVTGATVLDGDFEQDGTYTHEVRVDEIIMVANGGDITSTSFGGDTRSSSFNRIISIGQSNEVLGSGAMNLAGEGLDLAIVGHYEEGETDAIVYEGELADGSAMLLAGSGNAIMGTVNTEFAPLNENFIVSPETLITCTEDGNIHSEAAGAHLAGAEMMLLSGRVTGGMIGGADGLTPGLLMLGQNPEEIVVEGELANTVAKTIGVEADVALASVSHELEGEAEEEQDVITVVSSVTCTSAGDVIVQLGQ